jgi:hypothetical protein
MGHFFSVAESVVKAKVSKLAAEAVATGKEVLAEAIPLVSQLLPGEIAKIAAEHGVSAPIVSLVETVANEILGHASAALAPAVVSTSGV